MNKRQEELLVIYRRQWEELNVINALRAELEARAREIHASQRQLANKIAVLGAAESTGSNLEDRPETMLRPASFHDGPEES